MTLLLRAVRRDLARFSKDLKARIIEIRQGSVDESMESERESQVSSGPDIERFLEDAAAAAAEYARRMSIRYVIPSPDQHTIDTNSSEDGATEYPDDIDNSVSPGPSFLARIVPCYNSRLETAGAGPDPKRRIAHARGWKTAPCFIGAEFGERLGSTSVSYNLIVYLTSRMNLSLVKAVSISSAAFGASNLAPFLGVFLADASLGRFTTVSTGSIFYLGGLVIFTLLLMEKSLQPPCQSQTEVLGDIELNCSEATAFQMSILLLSLTLQTIGSGGIRPCAAPCGADQFDASSAEQQKQIQKFFRWHEFCMWSAMMIAATVVIWVQDKVDWGWGSFLPTVTMLLALTALLFGIPFYRSVHANGSPLTSLVQVLVAAIRKRKLSLPENSDKLHEVKPEDFNDVLLHTESMRWLDKAAVLEGSREGDSDQSTPWMLCTVQQVEELKKMLRMAPIWLCASASAIVYVQTFTIMTKQAMTNVDLNVSKHFQIPAASMVTLSILTFLLFVPLYDAYLVKTLRKLTGQTRGLTSLQRVGAGIFMGIFAMAMAATVESRRRYVAGISPTSTVSGFLLVPQFVLAGLGEGFLVPGLLVFFNDETPGKFQGMGKIFIWTALGMAGILNAIIIAILQFNGWFGDHDINAGRIDYFYFTLSVIGVVVFLVYIFIASSYKYTVKTDNDPSHTKFETTCSDTRDDSS